VRNYRVSLVFRICLFSLLLSSAMSSQMPAPLGKLHITSIPAGAIITINGMKRNELTDVTLAVYPARYTVSVTGGPGNLNCLDKAVDVRSGQQAEVKCTDRGWM